eukprot:11326878-Alexandrium_andersonii.AAC.1
MGALGACLMARLHVGALIVIVLSHVGALLAVDAQGCMPHTQAANDVARRTWMFLRLHRSP